MKEKYRIKKMIDQRRDVEQRVLKSFMEATKDLEEKLAQALGMADMTTAERALYLETEIGEHLTVEEGDDGVKTVSLRGKPVARHTMPKLVGLENTPGATVQYTFGNLVEKEHEL